MARNRPITFIAVIAAFIFFYSYLLFPSSSSGTASPYSTPEQGYSSAKGLHKDGKDKIGPFHVSSDTIHGEVIMPKLGNETIKAELGRASWRLLHTMLARFPEKPSPDERDALKSYIYLFGRLYPCGECASHFRILLQRYPPQTSSRDAASQWGCVVHNAVNERLGKEIFDCGTIADKYHCGCAEEDEKKKKAEAEAELVNTGKDSSTATGAMGSGGDATRRKQKVVDDDEEGEMKLVKEGLTRGG
ncbi:hypothetical protein H072_4376 [Dactylellina haptotyla CBS 200.50]|uniref:Sulfhydryl oxidase n=1 Tax=Dactylellina haptotyla (strain CBS 200.50) TaxID=1284197 RepID=S8AKV4_DACHA|nr:hypothetical protein H072_4376 [Dactylellina haptotyla CBS 200.50]